MTEVPAYLTQIKRDIEEEYDYIRRLQDEEEEENEEAKVEEEDYDDYEYGQYAEISWQYDIFPTFPKISFAVKERNT